MCFGSTPSSKKCISLNLLVTSSFSARSCSRRFFPFHLFPSIPFFPFRRSFIERILLQVHNLKEFWIPYLFRKLFHELPCLPFHRSRKGIFNCFSKFSKLIFDLSGLIDQNESETSNSIP